MNNQTRQQNLGGKILRKFLFDDNQSANNLLQKNLRKKLVTKNLQLRPNPSEFNGSGYTKNKITGTKLTMNS